MTRVEAAEIAIKMITEGTNVIIQKSDEKDIMVFKFHKLEYPNCQVSLAINGKVEKDCILKLEDAFPLLIDAVELSS
jgi:hypothetical protein